LNISLIIKKYQVFCNGYDDGKNNRSYNQKYINTNYNNGYQSGYKNGYNKYIIDRDRERDRNINSDIDSDIYRDRDRDREKRKKNIKNTLTEKQQRIFDEVYKKVTEQIEMYHDNDIDKYNYYWEDPRYTDYDIDVDSDQEEVKKIIFKFEKEERLINKMRNRKRYSR